MSRARIKYDPLVPKKVNVPFKFLGKDFTTGEPFDPAETKASARQMKNLYLTRRLINAEIVVPTQEVKPPKLTQEEEFEKAKAELAAEQQAAEVVEEVAPAVEKKPKAKKAKAKAKVEPKVKEAPATEARPWEA